jgi:FKBP-type peptidyl-prolyl cis-trans isomerase
MKKGETARFLVPSFLAYGAQGTEIIPPYSPIIYVVESK